MSHSPGAFFLVANDLVFKHAAEIGSNALALYVILACHAKSGTGECYPSVRRLMRLMGRSRPVVTEAMRVLQERDLVTVTQRRSEYGGQASNLYTLLPLPVEAGSDSDPADGSRGQAAEWRAARGAGGRIETEEAEAAQNPAGVVQMAAGVAQMPAGETKVCVPGVVQIAASPGAIGCVPPVQNLSPELCELNQTNENKTNRNQMNLTRRTAEPARPARRADRMDRPLAEEAASFFLAEGSSCAEAKRFWNYYESKGWLVGRSPMRDWRAAARNWIGRDREEGQLRRQRAPAGSGSRLAELSERNEARLEAMRARGALGPRSDESTDGRGTACRF